MAKKYQNSSDLNAALNQAVERRKDQEKKFIDPKERWKLNRAADRRKRSIIVVAILVPLVVCALTYGAFAMGFRLGKPSELKDALANPQSTTQLNLSAKKLGEYPEEVSTLKSLQVFQLNNNGIKTLPPSVGELKSLQTLGLQYNELSILPDEIGALKELRELDLKGNKLGSLPARLTELSKLKVLDLTNNQLTELPKEVGDLTGLQVLRLRGNSISVLPKSFSQLRELKELDLSGNPVTELPAPSQLPNLRKLALRGTKIPPSVGKHFQAKLPKVSVMQ